MTTFMDRDRTCAICGAVSEHQIITSSNRFGSTDLDTRPPQMLRSTMFAWVQECPKCGYVAADIEKETSLSQEFLKDQAYSSCDGINFKSDLAKRFYKHYKILEFIGDKEQAFYAALYAAWECDDEKDQENSVRCRNLALKSIEALSGKKKEDTIMLMKMDLLRRTEQFDQLINEFENIHFKNDMYNKIAEFQIQKAKEKDTACYTVDAAVDRLRSYQS